MRLIQAYDPIAPARMLQSIATREIECTVEQVATPPYDLGLICANSLDRINSKNLPPASLLTGQHYSADSEPARH